MNKDMCPTPDEKEFDDLPFLDSPPRGDEDFTPTDEEFRMLAKDYMEKLLNYEFMWFSDRQADGWSTEYNALCRLSQISKIIGLDALSKIKDSLYEEYQKK